MAPPAGHVPLVSVVIPLRNGRATLGEQLAALSVQDYSEPWELIVSDNGSTDGGADLVGGWAHPAASARVVDSSDQPGVSHARNVGAGAARGGLLAFCDADDVVHRGWLAALVRAAERHDVVGGALEIESLNPPELRSVRPNPQGQGLPMGLGFLRYAIGANFAVSRAVFDRLGGWDTRFAGGSDDVDFCWRAQFAGYSIGFAHDAVVSYRFRPGLRALVRQYYRYGLMEPRLYQIHTATGVRRRTWRQVAVSCRWFLRPRGPGAAAGGRTVDALWRSRSARHTWLSEFAYLIGRVRGSVRARCLFV